MTPFVPLEFPSWIRWGQRKGAFIDNAALRALYPDHRYHEHLPDQTFRLTGIVRRCGWCAGECKGRRTSWCSDQCANKFYRVWSWGAVSNYVAARDADVCRRCEKRGSEVDHILPVKDGGTDDPANLRLLCHDCHVAAGYEQRRARRERVELALPAR